MANSKLATNGNASSAVLHRPNRFVTGLLKFIETCYGLFILGWFTVNMYTGNKSFRVMDSIDKKELAEARDRLWNLQKRPFGLLHRFCKLRDGTRLHYVISLPEKLVEGKTGLVIFLHGFPDSWHVWHPLLKKANLKENATLVAVDLPGYGGSDGLASYDADHVLDVVAEFIIHMRESYLSISETGHGPVIVAGHDWGCVIASRLAAEAPVLADRFILSNAFAPAVARANIQSRSSSARQMLSTWINNPTNIRPLRQIYPTLKPIITQVVKSGYVFCFRLPWPVSMILGKLGDFWFYRLLNTLAIMNKPADPVVGAFGWDMLASSLGPGPSQVRSGKGTDDEDYGDSDSEHLAYASALKKRSKSGGWGTKIRIYQDGLATRRWTKSMQTLWELNQIEHATASFSSASSGSSGRRRSGSRVSMFDTGPKGAFGAATTILWGEQDIACNQAIAMDGVGDFFGVRGSHFITLPKVGHWTTYNAQGVDIWEAVIHWAITGEKDTMQQLMHRYPAAKLSAER